MQIRRYSLAQQIANQALRFEKREDRARNVAENADTLILSGALTLGAGLLTLPWSRIGTTLCLAGAGLCLPSIVAREAARHDAQEAHVISVGLRLGERKLIG